MTSRMMVTNMIKQICLRQIRVDYYENDRVYVLIQPDAKVVMLDNYLTFRFGASSLAIDYDTILKIVVWDEPSPGVNKRKVIYEQNLS